MEQVLDHYNLRPQLRSIRNGEGLEGACPIHQGTNDTQFKISLSKNCWNCFSDCKCGGNVLDFIAKMEQIDIYAAALKANDWFNLGLGQPPQRREQRNAANAPQREHAPPTTAAQAPPVASPASPADDDPVEIGCNKPLGFKLDNLDTEHRYFKERGLLPETVAAFGLGYCAKGTMAVRVVIPIHNQTGELVAYVGRVAGEPSEDRPKYKLPTGFKKSAEVFNLHRAILEPDDEPLIIVREYFEVLKLWQLGWKRVVSLMGSTLSNVQEELIKRATNRSSLIALLFAENESGRKSREQMLPRLAKFAYVQVIGLPDEGMKPEHLTLEEVSTYLPIPTAHEPVKIPARRSRSHGKRNGKDRSKGNAQGIATT